MSEILNYLEDEVGGGKTWENLSEDERTRIVKQRVEEVLNQPEVPLDKEYFHELLSQLRVKYIAGIDNETATHNLDDAFNECNAAQDKLLQEQKRCEKMFQESDNMIRALKRSTHNEARRKFYGTKDGAVVGEVGKEMADLVELAKHFRDIQVELFKNSVWARCISVLAKEVERR